MSTLKIIAEAIAGTAQDAHNNKMAKIKQIYLDNAATTKVDAAVVKEMQRYMLEDYGNASSSHEKGRKSREAVENARKIIAESINSNSEEIFFTSGGTESNNWALKGLFMNHENKLLGKNHIITTKIEHDSVLDVCKWLENLGARISYLDVDKEGFIDLKQLEKEINDKTLAVSIIHGHNEIGTIQNLEKIGKICKEKKVYFHTDACQSYTKTMLDAKKYNLDLITLNGHKIHGPKGIGVLYIRKGTRISPLIHGGGHEKGMRSGTENVPAIAGLAKAVELAQSSKENVKRMQKLQEAIIKKIISLEKTKLNGSLDLTRRLCNNIHVCFHNIEGEAIAGYLNNDKIFISTGSACASHKLEKSNTLRAIGLNDLEINSSIRISISKNTTIEESDYFANKLKSAVEKLRLMSPFN